MLSLLIPTDGNAKKKGADIREWMSEWMKNECKSHEMEILTWINMEIGIHLYYMLLLTEFLLLIWGRRGVEVEGAVR